MAPDGDAVGDDRTFAAASRYAANAVTGVRWLDDRTGQEQWSRSAGVDTLLQAGATIESPEDVRIATRVKISPHKGSGGWTANITRKQLDSRHEEDGVVKLLGTQDYCDSEGFDEREDAVSWAESEVEAYAGAEIKDAVEWSEQRFSKDDGEGEAESADEEAEGPEQAKLVTDGGQDAVEATHDRVYSTRIVPSDVNRQPEAMNLFDSAEAAKWWLQEYLAIRHDVSEVVWEDDPGAGEKWTARPDDLDGRAVVMGKDVLTEDDVEENLDRIREMEAMIRS